MPNRNPASSTPFRPTPPGNRGRRVCRPLGAGFRASKWRLQSFQKIKVPGSNHEFPNPASMVSFPRSRIFMVGMRDKGNRKDRCISELMSPTVRKPCSARVVARDLVGGNSPGKFLAALDGMGRNSQRESRRARCSNLIGKFGVRPANKT